MWHNEGEHVLTHTWGGCGGCSKLPPAWIVGLLCFVKLITKYISIAPCASCLGLNHRRLHENKITLQSLENCALKGLVDVILQSTAQGVSIRCHIETKLMYKQVRYGGYKYLPMR